ncbi:DUF7079 family protein [Chryseobacterium sp. JK1]|uniref:DUF7079 family protein n=1 Tax=Chryseobacterium sp. JK1 TaxID=874294 RepID=UPI003D69DEFC
MKFLRRFLKQFDISNNSKVTFDNPRPDQQKLFIPLGQLTLFDDFLKIENYPFKPSIAYKQNIFKSAEMDDIDFRSYPPNFRIENELIFLPKSQNNEIELFAKRNTIKTVQRPPIWSWLLEPFLDTEYTQGTDQKLMENLSEYGLSVDQISLLRAEVESQMLQYNFDTMLWEWVSFDTSDVLRAMRPKYKKNEFESFYKRVMKVALLTKQTD